MADLATEDFTRPVFLASAIGHRQRELADACALQPLDSGDPARAYGLLRKWGYDFAYAEQVHVNGKQRMQVWHS